MRQSAADLQKKKIGGGLCIGKYCATHKYPGCEYKPKSVCKQYIQFLVLTRIFWLNRDFKEKLKIYFMLIFIASCIIKNMQYACPSHTGYKDVNV